MSSRLSSNVGRIINFPRRNKNGESVQLLRVALPIAVALAWQILQRTDAFKSATGEPKRAPRGARNAGARAAVRKTAPPAGKATRKGRRSARYYAVTSLIVALENPTTRRLLISGLKLLRNVL
jgi:hypothetical protein